MNFIAAVFLIHLAEESAFWALTAVVEDLIPGVCVNHIYQFLNVVYLFCVFFVFLATNKRIDLTYIYTVKSYIYFNIFHYGTQLNF